MEPAKISINMKFERPQTAENDQEVEAPTIDVSLLGEPITHGGSSLIYELPNGYVAKESLSETARAIVGNRPISPPMKREIALQEAHLSTDEKNRMRLEAEKVKQKLMNNLVVCRKYLADFLLETHIAVQENKNGVPVVYKVQKELPEDHVTLDPDAWDITLDDHVRAELNKLIDGIEEMYAETGMMIDLLTLNNIAFSASSKTFFVYDIDPMICSNERLQQLQEQFTVDSTIGHTFSTALDNITRDALEANLENLKALKSLLSTLK